MKAKTTQKTVENTESQSDWVKTQSANLVRYKSSGIYFARVRIRGKLFRQSLKTDVLSVAKLRLIDFIKEKRDERGDDTAVTTGKMTVGDALAVLRKPWWRIQSRQLSVQVEQG